MRVIIAGSRAIDDYSAVARAVESCGVHPDVVLSGCCRGVDRCGERWAMEHKIAIERHPADWARYGRAAGIIRNAEMVKRADVLIAVLSNAHECRGTNAIVKLAIREGLQVYVRELP